MNYRSALPLSVVLLTFFSSCSKHQNIPDDSGTILPEFLFHTWTIDDEDPLHYNETACSVTFKDKKYPIYKINSDNTYSLDYIDHMDHHLSEKGMCIFNSDTKIITFYPGVPPPQAGAWVDLTNYCYDSYQFGVKTLTEEHLTLIGTHKKITYTYDSEGVAHAVTQNENEVLYLEDND